MKISVLIISILAVPAYAQTPQTALEDYKRASERLGRLSAISEVIASEEFCGLTFDKDKVAAWVTAQAGDGDMNFGSDLNGHVFMAQSVLPTYGETLKRTHCALVKKTAQENALMP